MSKYDIVVTLSVVTLIVCGLHTFRVGFVWRAELIELLPIHPILMKDQNIKHYQSVSYSGPSGIVRSNRKQYTT